MAKETFTTKHTTFRKDIIGELQNKISNSKKISKFQDVKVLKVKNTFFNLDGDRYLVEVSNNGLIDNEGYDYSFEVLDTEQLCELADGLL